MMSGEIGVTRPVEVHLRKAGAVADVVVQAMEGVLSPGETQEHEFVGLSAGLNASPRAGRYPAHLWILPTAVIVGRSKPGLRAKAEVERFSLSEIMSVQELEVAKTGLAGAMDRKTASHALGGLFGATADLPAILLSTRRGDVTFAFAAKQRGQVRAAFVAISDLIG